MVNGISSSQSSTSTAMLQGMSRKSPEEMFKQLSTDAGGDGTSITKDQLQTYIDKLKSEGKDAKPLDDILSNFDTISNGSDSITSSDIDTAMKNGTLKPPEKPDSESNTSTTNSTATSSSVSTSSTSTSSSSSNTPTTQQLKSYLNELRADGYSGSDIASKIQNTINGQTVTPALTVSSIEQAISELKAKDDPSSLTPAPTPKEESHKGTIADMMA